MPDADPQSEKINQLAHRVDEIRAGLREEAPGVLAMRTGARFTPGENTGLFHLHLWGQDITIDYPSFVARKPESGEPLPVDVQALLAYHFQTSQGTPLTGRWVAFSELPGGRFYAHAYQGYSGGALLRAFGADLAAFEAAAKSAGGERVAFADAAYAFLALPRVALLAAYWLGDEDFPSNAQILFDASIQHHLPTDVCAVLGGMLAGKIVKAGRAAA